MIEYIDMTRIGDTQRRMVPACFSGPVASVEDPATSLHRFSEAADQASTVTARLLTKARDAILQRRYAPATGKPRRTAVLWPREPGGQPQMLVGHASQHRTRGGCLYNRRVRLVRRFGLSAFKRKD